MALNFPSTPSVNDTHSANGSTWLWDGDKWISLLTTFTSADDVNTVSYSATPAFDVDLGLSQKITLTGNVTSSTITNMVTGQHITFLIIQDGTGSRSFVWPTNMFGGMDISLAGANQVSVQKFFCYDGTNLIAESAGVTV